MKSYIGLKFGELTVISQRRVPPNPEHKVPTPSVLLTVKCSCGTVKEIRHTNTNTKTCGDTTIHKQQPRGTFTRGIKLPTTIVHYKGKSKPFDLWLRMLGIQKKDIKLDLLLGKSLVGILEEYAKSN
jgi:hypothetical protein